MSLFDRLGEGVEHYRRQQRAGVPGLGPKVGHAAKHQARRTGLVTQAGWAPEARGAERARQAAHTARRGVAEAEGEVAHPALTPHEHVVLGATSEFKSSHMGRDRRGMVHNETGYHMPEEHWNAAKATLHAKGHLNKAGAITPQGKAHLKSIGGGVSHIVKKHNLPVNEQTERTTVSLLDRLMPGRPVSDTVAESATAPSLGDRVGAKTLIEASGAPVVRPLWEDLIAKPMRFWNARDIQYAIEDLAMAAERFQDGEGRFALVKYSRRRNSESCEDEKKGKTMLGAAVKELRGAASSMKKCADYCDSD